MSVALRESSCLVYLNSSFETISCVRHSIQSEIVWRLFYSQRCHFRLSAKTFLIIFNTAKMNILLLLLAFVTLPVQGQDVNSNFDSSCTSFESNGIAANTYTHYRLYDFRNINSPSSTSNPDSETVKIVEDSSWTDDWYIRDYPRKSPAPPSIPVAFTPKRVNVGTCESCSERDWDLY